MGRFGVAPPRRWTRDPKTGAMILQPVVGGGSAISLTWTETIYSMPASSSALSNSTTATMLTPTVPCILPANFFSTAQRSGGAIRIVARGIVTTPSSGGASLSLKVGYDTTVGTLGATLASVPGSGTLTPTASLSSAPWEMEFDAVCQSLGTSGTILCEGVFAYGAASTTAATALMIGSGTAVTINTEASAAIELQAAWGAANATDSITLTQFLVMGLT